MSVFMLFFLPGLLGLFESSVKSLCPLTPMPSSLLPFLWQNKYFLLCSSNGHCKTDLLYHAGLLVLSVSVYHLSSLLDGRAIHFISVLPVPRTEVFKDCLISSSSSDLTSISFPLGWPVKKEAIIMENKPILPPRIPSFPKATSATSHLQGFVLLWLCFIILQLAKKFISSVSASLLPSPPPL